MIKLYLVCKYNNPIVYQTIYQTAKSLALDFTVILVNCNDRFKSEVGLFLEKTYLGINSKIEEINDSKILDFFNHEKRLYSVTIMVDVMLNNLTHQLLNNILISKKDIMENNFKVYFNPQKTPKLLLLSNVYNEEYLLPFWCRHHKDIFDHTVIVDYNSTDRSLEIIKEICPDWEIRKTKNNCFGALEIDAEFNDIEEEFGEGYYKIILNTTEFIMSDYSIKYLLPDGEPLQLKSIIPYNKQESFPQDLKSLFKSVTHFSDDLYFRSPRYFHSYKRCNYGLGRHTINHSFQKTDNAYIFWTGFYPWNTHLINRRLQVKNQIPNHDIQRGYSYHHFWGVEKMQEEKKKLESVCKDISTFNFYDRYLESFK